ncbi:hypothetical protein GN244_ATG12874 [Phytophthora infestans]|uniref:Uncharacterized protein n=1 Tax=Phytophthora infestans TaxID=4787 RepID=A0A833VZ80_PHYIN|nr:hypothetical protein GN244_ATG12874 [Phytophthora infestans]KAF4134723.1 hypothetical protein GN958_ATG15979 [Phytophthora infestans]
MIPKPVFGFERPSHEIDALGRIVPMKIPTTAKAMSAADEREECDEDKVNATKPEIPPDKCTASTADFSASDFCKEQGSFFRTEPNGFYTIFV